jgi:hypothetical protein
MNVEMLSVDGCLIDLEVSCVHDRPGRRVNRHRHAVGDAVRHTQEFDFAVADANPLARPDSDEAFARIDPVFFELGLDQRKRQRGAVHGAVDEGPHIRHPTDVIFVPMREDQRRGPRVALLQVRQIGDEEIDPG